MFRFEPQSYNKNPEYANFRAKKDDFII